MEKTTSDTPAAVELLPSSTSDSGEEPPSISAVDYIDNAKQKAPERDRGAKRRKNCQNLEGISRKFDPSSLSSFTFDAKFVAGTPDLTPKFGYFKVLDPATEEQQSGEKSEVSEEFESR